MAFDVWKTTKKTKWLKRKTKIPDPRSVGPVLSFPNEKIQQLQKLENRKNKKLIVIRPLYQIRKLCKARWAKKQVTRSPVEQNMYEYQNKCLNDFEFSRFYLVNIKRD